MKVARLHIRTLLLMSAVALLVTAVVIPSPLEAAKEILCSDGIDNDGDGKIDCDDPNCKKDLACGGGGGAGGGEGNPTTPAVIDFRDSPPMPTDRIQSDGGGPYLTQDFGAAGVVNVIIGSKANPGNVFIVGDEGGITSPMPASTRTLSLDFSVCAMGPCTPPFGSGSVRAGFRVNVNEVLKNGIYAIAAGQMVMAPMTLQFLSGGVGWFVHFDPTVKNCGGSSQVEVRNVGPDTWEVEANSLGCLVQGGHPQAESSGLFDMPFLFTVSIL